jgi:hypothetical protein
VHSIAGQLFDRTLLLAADNEVEHPALPLRRSIVPNQEQVSSINKRRKNTRWIGDGKVTRLHTGNRTIYTAVQILGVTYKAITLSALLLMIPLTLSLCRKAIS